MAIAAKPKASKAFWGWTALAILSFGYLLVMIVRLASAVTTTELGRDLALGPSEQGLISSGAIWGYAAMTLFAGVLADSIGPRKAVTVISILTVIGAFFFATATGLPSALIGRILMGVGTGITYVCALKIIALWFSGGRFATLTGVIQTVGNLGSLLAAGPLAFAVSVIGWRSSFNLLTVCAALFVVLVVLLVRDSPESLEPKTENAQSKHQNPINNAGFVSQLQSVIRNPNLWKLSLFMFMFQMSVLSIQGLWAVPYMIDVFGLEKQIASNNVSMWGLAVVLTCPFIGYFSDRVLRSRKQVIIAAILVMAAMQLIFIFLGASVPTWLLPVLFFIGGLAHSMIMVGFAFVNDIFPKVIVGTALGLYNFWIFVGGAISQQITGVILSQYPAAGAQGSAEGYRMVFLFCLGGLVISFLASISLREKRLVAEDATPPVRP